MKIRGSLVGMLLEIDLEKNKDFAIGEVRNKVLHAYVIKAQCGILMKSFLHCKKNQERHYSGRLPGQPT